MLVIVPGRPFGELLAVTIGLIRRYGAAEPTVVQALLRLLATCATLVEDDPPRWSAIERETELLVDAAVREVRQAVDLELVHASADDVRRILIVRRGGSSR